MYAKIIGLAVAVLTFILLYLANYAGSWNIVVAGVAAALIASPFIYFDHEITLWFVARQSFAKVVEPVLPVKGSALKTLEQAANYVYQYNLGYQESRIAHLAGEYGKLKKNREVTQKVNLTKALTKNQADEFTKLERQSFKSIDFTKEKSEYGVISANNVYLGKALCVFWTPDNRLIVKYLNERNQVIYTPPEPPDDVLPRGWIKTVRKTRTLPIFFDENNKHVPEVLIAHRF